MRAHLLLSSVLLASACASVQAQGLASVPLGNYDLRWVGRTSLGLSVDRNALRVPCSTLAGCDELTVTGKATFLETRLGIYGRLGSVQTRSYAPALEPVTGMSFGAGVSWDFSRRLSATLGVESYELRPGTPVRATNLGLQWRY